jgi:hypothetical protein
MPVRFSQALGALFCTAVLAAHASSPAEDTAPGEEAKATQQAPANSPAKHADGEKAGKKAAKSAKNPALPQENPFPGTRMRRAPNGEILYCWKDTSGNSRIPQEHCANEFAMRERAAAGKEMVEDIRRGRGMYE